MPKPANDPLKDRLARLRARAGGRPVAPQGVPVRRKRVSRRETEAPAAAHAPHRPRHGWHRHRGHPGSRHPLRSGDQAEPDAGNGRRRGDLARGLLESPRQRSLRAGPAVSGLRPVRRAAAARAIPGPGRTVVAPVARGLGRHGRRSHVVAEDDRRSGLSPGTDRTWASSSPRRRFAPTPSTALLRRMLPSCRSVSPQR